MYTVQFFEVSSEFQIFFYLINNNFCCRCYSRIKVDFDHNICQLLQDHNHEKPIIDAYDGGVDVSDEVQIEQTNRGGSCVFHNDNRFVKCKENQGITHYRCSLYTKQCKARISIKYEKSILTGFHNHNWRYRENKIINHEPFFQLFIN